jgi:hypothetical protein
MGKDVNARQARWIGQQQRVRKTSVVSAGGARGGLACLIHANESTARPVGDDFFIFANRATGIDGARISLRSAGLWLSTLDRAHDARGYTSHRSVT